jgi:hypothetical protein
MQVKINEPVDLAEVRRVKEFIDGKMYSMTFPRPHGLEISVVIPYGSRKGLRLFALSVRQFIWAAWRSLV